MVAFFFLGVAFLGDELVVTLAGDLVVTLAGDLVVTLAGDVFDLMTGADPGFMRYEEILSAISSAFGFRKIDFGSALSSSAAPFRRFLGINSGGIGAGVHKSNNSGVTSSSSSLSESSSSSSSSLSSAVSSVRPPPKMRRMVAVTSAGGQPGFADRSMGENGAGEGIGSPNKSVKDAVVAGVADVAVVEDVAMDTEEGEVKGTDDELMHGGVATAAETGVLDCDTGTNAQLEDDDDDVDVNDAVVVVDVVAVVVLAAVFIIVLLRGMMNMV